MAQAYFQAVKLPTLLHIPHPNTKLNLRNEINVEGRNSNTSSISLRFNSGNDAKRSRSSMIASVLDDEHGRKSKEPKGSFKVTYDTMMQMIDEKLRTGYHGVKHLFKAQNPHKPGVLNREGFKHVLNSLCGYIPPEEWVKALRKFQLDKNDDISFAEFISHFDKNEKVRKDIKNANSRIEMLDINASPALAQRNNNQAPTEVSAIYCYALMKAKARSSDFKPEQIIPSECVRNESLILPFHLDQILGTMNLKLSDFEFKKLWKKFDVENVGGVRSKVFLRLINYNPNEIDELTENMNKLRTKSCIVSGLGSRSSNNSKLSKIHKRSVMASQTDNHKEDKVEPKQQQQQPVVKELKPIEMNEITEENDTRDQVVDYFAQKPDSAYRGTSFSETKVKFMVQKFKTSLQFKPKDNILTFLNNKLNAGYIAFRTAFEYIDPENYGHLLNQEFEAVLKEFDIEFKNHEYQKFLKQHGFMKRNSLVNYKAFLSVFHDQSENSITQEVVKDPKSYMKSDDSAGLTAKQADFKLVNLFHGFYLAALSAFKQTLGNQQHCSFDTFKSLIERSFSIKTDSDQIESLLQFIKQHENKDEILWLEFFKKFSELDCSMDVATRKATDPCSTAKNIDYEKFKYIKCKFGNIRTREKDLMPLGGTYFVDILKKNDEKRAVKIQRNFEKVKSYQRTRNKSSFLCSEFCGKRKNEKGPLFDRNKDFKITQSNPWCYFKELKDKMVTKASKGKSHEEQLNLVTARGKTEVAPVAAVVQKVEEKTVAVKKTARAEDNSNNNNNNIAAPIAEPKPEVPVVLTVRPLKELEKLIERMIRSQFHKLNKQFTLLDPGHTEKIDRPTFQTLASKLGLELNKAEIDLIWKDFHNEPVRFSNFVRRFFLPREFGKIKSIREKIELEKEIEKNQLSYRSRDFNDSYLGGGAYSDDQDDYENNKHDNQLRENLIQKIKQFVTKNWYILKQDFQIVDFPGAAYITNAKAMDILRKHKAPLEAAELEELCKLFNVDQNSSKFEYITFMRSISTGRSASEINRAVPKWNMIHPSFEKIIKKLREIYKEKKHNESNSVLRDFTNLRATFKKYDQSTKGYLTVQEFKEMLKQIHIELNSEDLYQMFAEYDPHLKGVFCYDIFIKSLIDKSF